MTGGRKLKPWLLLYALITALGLFGLVGPTVFGQDSPDAAAALDAESQSCMSCHAQTMSDDSHPVNVNTLNNHYGENCLSCHVVHGSRNQRLLVARVPNLCQDCHDWSRHPGSFYGGQHAWTNPAGAPNSGVSTRFIARSCTNCHNAVHGSNAPANRGKFLIR